MSFTKTHYVKIADCINNIRVKITTDQDDTENKLAVIDQFTIALKDLFAEDNPKFKELTFIGACNRDLLNK